MPGIQIQGLSPSGKDVPLAVNEDGSLLVTSGGGDSATATLQKDGWQAVTITGRTRDNTKDMTQNFADGTAQTIYFTAEGEYAGMGARA